VIFAGVRGFLDKMVTAEISKFESKFLSHMRTNYPKVIEKIRVTGKLDAADEQ
jgi:F-type H+-transporting ATPase subunit alpha